MQLQVVTDDGQGAFPAPVEWVEVADSREAEREILVRRSPSVRHVELFTDDEYQRVGDKRDPPKGLVLTAMGVGLDEFVGRSAKKHGVELEADPFGADVYTIDTYKHPPATRQAFYDTLSAGGCNHHEAPSRTPESHPLRRARSRRRRRAQT